MIISLCNHNCIIHHHNFNGQNNRDHDDDDDDDHQVVCEAAGSRPEPTLTWWLGDQVTP